MQKDSNFSPCERLDRLISVFSSLFECEFRTRLVGGQPEPFYQAAKSDAQYSVIYFSHDYFSSALHEIAHWCVAGATRRTEDDYGYWYAPDGRSVEQQREFEMVEVKPQAMERIFAFAAGQRFRLSVDNLNGDVSASDTFVQNVHQQTLSYCAHGLPQRAQKFAEALAKAFQQPKPLNEKNYCLEQLR